MSNAILVEPLAMPAVTASATAAGYDPLNVANIYMGVVWKSPTGAAISTAPMVETAAMTEAAIPATWPMRCNAMAVEHFDEEVRRNEQRADPA